MPRFVFAELQGNLQHTWHAPACLQNALFVLLWSLPLPMTPTLRVPILLHMYFLILGPHPARPRAPAPSPLPSKPLTRGPTKAGRFTAVLGLGTSRATTSNGRNAREGGGGGGPRCGRMTPTGLNAAIERGEGGVEATYATRAASCGQKLAFLQKYARRFLVEIHHTCVMSSWEIQRGGGGEEEGRE